MMVATARQRLGGTAIGVRHLQHAVAASTFFVTRRQLARYALVGLVCTAFQLALFRLLLWFAMPPAAANSAAFLASTQVNFALSHRFTWAHRHAATPQRPRQLLARCLAYNGAAVLGLGINAAAFWGCHSLLVFPPLASAVAALTVSTTVTYLLSSRVIFVAARDASHPAPCRPDGRS